MSKSKNKLNTTQSNIKALARASEFYEYHPVFAKYAKRKQLKPQEKSAITRKWKELANIFADAGGIGYLSVAPKKVAKKIRNNKQEYLFIGGFNILRLNNYNDGKTLDVNKYGDFVQRRKYEQSARHDLTKGRLFTFVGVDCNFHFYTRAYDNDIKDGEIYDRVKNKIIEIFNAKYKKRKKSIPNPAEFYLWGKQGVMYNTASSDFDLLMERLSDWIDRYLDKVIDANTALSGEIFGFSYHGNIQVQPPKPKARGNGKKKNRNR